MAGVAQSDQAEICVDTQVAASNQTLTLLSAGEPQACAE